MYAAFGKALRLYCLAGSYRALSTVYCQGQARSVSSISRMKVSPPRDPQSTRRLPDFLVVGAAKAGTTSLYYYLREHPGVFLPKVKEPNFFALEGLTANFRDPSSPRSVNAWSVTGFDDYGALFAAAKPEQASGECSPFYLYSDRAPRIIKKYVPQIRLVAVLRNPIDRAFSSFMYFRNNGLEPLESFHAALDEEERRMEHGWFFIWHYKSAGLYHDQLRRYFDCFGREQILILFHEDLLTDPLRTIQRVYEFIGVDPTFEPRSDLVYGASGAPTSQFADRLLFKNNILRKTARLVLPPDFKARLAAGLKQRFLRKVSVDDATQAYLAEYYRADVIKLSQLIGKDLSTWLECPPAGP